MHEKVVTTVRIQPETIPRIEAKILSSTILESVIDFYKDPKNEAAFEEWMVQRNTKSEEE